MFNIYLSLTLDNDDAFSYSVTRSDPTDCFQTMASVLKIFEEYYGKPAAWSGSFRKEDA